VNTLYLVVAILRALRYSAWSRWNAMQSRLLDAYDVIHVFGTGRPITGAQWAARFGGGASAESVARRWERFKRWCCESGLPVERITVETEAGGCVVALLFRHECAAIVSGALPPIESEQDEECAA
jgi:hypothetical protein